MKDNKTKDVAVYEAPRVELCEIRVEQGFNVSGTGNEPVGGREDELPW